MRKIFTSCSAGINMPVNYKKSVIAFLVVLCGLMMKSEMGWGQSQTFNTNGTFTVPVGVTSVTVECWGAGAGGSNRSGAAGGGGGGAYTKGVISGLSYGNILNVTVGTGGVAGLPTTAPGNFSRVVFGANTITANGGLSVSDSRTGGSGGAASAIGGIITASYKGGDGGDARASAILSNNEAGGGGGGSAFTNTNGNPGSDGGNSTSSATPGGTGTGTGGEGASADGSPNATVGGAPGAGGGGRGEGGGTSGAGANGRVVITYTQLTYKSQINSVNFGSSTWCPGETRSVTVSVTNVGTATWTDGASGTPDINIGLKWDSDPDFGSPPGNIARQNAGNLTPGATATYTFPIVTPVIASGTDHLSVDVVYEAVAWFRGNSPTGIGPGNSMFVSSAITIGAAPSINTQPSTATQTLCQGITSTALSVTAGGTGLSYQWYSNTTASNSGGTPVGANSPNYTPSTATPGTLYYYCVITGTCGSMNSNVSGAITVNARPTGVLSGSTSICIGSTATLTITATGSGTISGTLSDGTAFSGTAPTITVSVSPASATSYVIATLSDANCTSIAADKSGTATVTVSNPAAPSGNASQSFCADANPTVSDLGATETSIQWYAAATGGSPLSSTTPLVNGTHYYASQTVGGCESATRMDVTANVYQPPVITADPNPAAQTVCATDNVSYSVTATGTGLTYQWLLNGNPISDGGRISGATSSTLTITGVTTADAGDYTVVVSGTSPCSPVTSAIAHLDVTQSITFSAQPATPKTLCPGDTYTIYAQAAGATGPGSTYQWYFNGSFYATGTFNGTDTYTLTIPNVTSSNAGSYRLFLDDGSGTTCSKANSNIAVLNINTNTTVTDPIATQTICQNTSPTNLSVTASGTGPFTYQWYSNTVNDNTTGSSIGSATNSTYTPPATAAGTTYYYVMVTGACNSVTSATSEVIVNPVTAISAPPTSLSPYCQNATATALSVTASGTGTLSYQWYSNTVNSNSGGTVVGTNSSSYTPLTTTAGTLYYYVTVTGDCGSATSATAAVIVTPITVITADPQTTQTICQNSTPANLLVTATGTGTLTYQWYSNTINSNSGGMIIAAAESASYTPQTTTPGTTYYYVVATGDCGNATSNTATVNVTVIPTATISYAGTPFCKSVTSAQLVTITGSGAYIGGTYAASPSGLTINGSTGNITPSSSTAGTYTVTYTIPASGGCSSVPVTTSVTITAVPTATITYAGTPFCKSVISAQPVTLTGTGAYTGGTYSAPAGLTIDPSTGAITPSSSTAGTYTVTYTTPVSVGCSSVQATKSVTITEVPTATISYAGTPFCKSVTSAQLVTITGSGAYIGGTYAASPSGLTINGSTGNITPSSSTAGTYTVTYTIPASGGCSSVPVTTSVTITAVPTATITYAGTPFCKSVISTQPVTLTGTGAYTGGTYSAPAGLTIDPSTGAITPSSSTAGTYTVTYTTPVSGGCSSVQATKSVTITEVPTATISYAGTPFCKSVTSAQLVTITGSGAYIGGTYAASPSGLTINGSTGNITPSSSTAGTYTVTYTIPASGGCSSVPVTTSVTITAVPTATITYAGTPFCKSVISAQPVTLTGTGAYTGGTYSAPAGLTIDPSTGAITPSSSTAGTYTVTYTTPVSVGCSSVQATKSVTITEVPTATISYAGTPFCKSVTSAQLVTITGSGAYIGGTYAASPSGLTINGSTGNITPSSSTAGTYTVTYTIPASGGCSSVPVTTFVTIAALPTATITYAGSPYCSNTGTATITQTGQAGGTYSASPAGLSIDNSTGAVNLAASTPGSYTVTYSFTDGTCSNTAIANITVNALPTITSVTATPATICLGTSSNLVVNAPANAAITIVNYDFNSGGSYGALVSNAVGNISSSVAGSAGFATGTGTVTGTNAFVTNSTAGNALSNSEGDNWTFTLTGSDLSKCKTFKIYYQATSSISGRTLALSYSLNGGAYITTGVGGNNPLTLGTSYGQAVVTLPVTTDNPATSLAFRLTSSTGTGTSTIKLDNFQVQAVPQDAYSWIASPSGASAGLPANAGTSLTTNNNINVSPTVTTTYTVTATNGSGCQQTGTPVTVTVNPIPTATISGDATVCQGSTPAPVITFTNPMSLAVTATYNINGSGTTTINIPANGNSTVNAPTGTAGTFAYNLVSVAYQSTPACSNPVTLQTATVTVLATPAPTIGGTTTVCQNGTSPNVIFSNPQSLPVTITYDINGAAPLTINVAANASANVAAPTGTAGTFIYTIQSVVYQGGPSCPANISGQSATVTVRPTPLATISGDIAVCENSAPAPVITFTNPMNLPVTITYNINGTGTTTINVPANGTNTVTASTAAAGSFAYNVVSVSYQTAPNCPNTITGQTATVTVNPLPTATINGTTIVCQNSSQPNITFTGSNGTAPYTFTYKINAGAPQTVTTVAGNSADVSVPTATTGVYTYTLLSVQDASSTTCSQVQSGTAAVTVKEPVAIMNQPVSETTCATYPVSFSVTATGDDLTYQWYHNGSPLADDANISGSQTAQLDIDQAGTGDIGTYYVIVSGSSACGAIQSDNVTLAVNQSIVINTQPAAQAVCTGGTATFTVSASGTGINYQWRKGTVPLSDGIQPGGSSISGSKAATLTITGVSASDAAANYNVVMTTLGGGCPQANSANRKLVVNPVPAADPVTDKNICAGTVSGAINFSGGITGTVYDWTNSDPSIGLAAGGSGNNLPSFTATNSGTVPVTATIIVTPTYTNAGTPAATCSGAPVTFTITVNPTATVNPVPNQVLCNGSSTTAVNFGSAATGGTIVYNWTNDKPSIGLAASGSGDIGSFVATNTGTAPVTATIKVTPSYTNGTANCTGTPLTFTITVNPTATADPIANQVICSGSAIAAINFTSPVSGGSIVYNWTDDNPSIGLTAVGAGNIGSFIATNTGTAPVSANITVTPSYSNGSVTCPGTPQTFTITVNPAATVDAVPDQTLCSGSSTTAINFSSPVTGGSIVYNWTNNNASIGLAASGAGNIAAFTAGNAGTVPVTATITVTPSYTNGGKTCTGTPVTFKITVNPGVNISPATQNICSGGSIATIGISGLPSGTITSWTRTMPVGVTSPTIGASGTGPISGIFTSTNATGTPVVFTITATTGTCVTTTTATVNVYGPVTAPVIGDNQVVCNFGTAGKLTMITPPAGGNTPYTYQWQSSANGTTGWADITGATATTYTPPTSDMYYRLIVTSGSSCGIVTSNVVRVQTTGTLSFDVIHSITPAGPYCPKASGAFQINMSTLSLFRVIKYAWTYDATYINDPNGAQPDNDAGGILTPYTKQLTFGTKNTTNQTVTTTVKVTPLVMKLLSSTDVDCILTPAQYDIVIYPVPVATATPSPQAICSANPVNISLTSNITDNPTTFNWTAALQSGTATGFTNGTSGSVSPSSSYIIPDVITNTGSADAVVKYTITPTSAGNCAATPTTVLVTVHPNAVIPTQNITVCNGVPFTFTPTNNPPSTIVPAGTTYSWGVPAGTGFTGGAAGSGSAVSGTLTNPGTAPVIATYTVTPAVGTCTGVPFTLNVTVNPTPAAAISATDATVCSGTGTTINFTGTANTVVAYKVNGGTTQTITLNSSGTATLNTGSLTVNTTYTLAGVAFPGTPPCSQVLSGGVTVNVNPVATATITAGTSPVCSGQSSGFIFTGTPNTIVTYNDGTANQTVTLNAGGTATVTVNPTGTTTYTLISAGYPGTPNCLNGLSGSATITVSPNANAGTITGTSPLCINATATYTSNGDAGGSWSSSNTTVAIVNSVTGVVTAKAAGTTNIIYTVNSGCNSPVSVSQQLIVNPNANAGTITGGTGAPICVGSLVVFSSTGDPGGIWTTSDGTVATVSTSGVVTAKGTGTATITYTVNSGCNPPASATKTVQVVNAGALLDPGPISGPPGTICANTQFVFTVPAVADATFYVWTLPPGWTTSGSTTTTTNSITVTTNTGGPGTITVTAGNACGFSPSSSSLTVTVSYIHIWVGNTPDWNTASNWCGGIPTAATDVMIPATGPGAYYLPVLSTDAQAHDITMPAGSNIDLNGRKLTINGAFSGTGTLSGSAASGLSVTGAAGTVYFNQAASYNQLKTLTVNSGGSLKLGDNGGSVHDILNIAAGNSVTGYGTVTVNGTLNANGTLTLKSDANGTAMVGQSNGTISGDVTVERFIPPLRAWRFMAVPFSNSGQTVWQAWQEGVNNYGIDYATFNKNPHPGYGTHITGNNYSNLGYDFNTTENPSYKVWDPIANTWKATEPPTISTPITSFNGAYCIFVRGSRAVNLSMGTDAPADPTVLRSTGTLNQTGPVAPKTYSGGAGKFVMIGNPYVSPINILNIINRSSGIDHDKFWVWDPKIVGAGTDNVGAYVSYKNGVLAPPAAPSFPNGINDAQLLQSSQAFMVQLSAGSSAANMDFRETDKLTQSVGVFGLKAAKSTKPTDPVIYTNLMLGKGKNMMLVDGVAAGFNKRFKAAVDDDDAAKLWNFDENISLVRDGKPLAIEFRPAINKKDTLFYDLRLKKKSYTLKIFAANVAADSPAQAWLIDKYLGRQTLINLNDTSYYSFTPASDTANDRNRFILVFNRGKDVKPKAESTVHTASVYPNPVSANNFNLVLQDFIKGDYKVNIYNSNGNLIITRSIHYEGSKNAFNFKLPVNVIAGNYTLKVLNYSGDVLSTIPVLISK